MTKNSNHLAAGRGFMLMLLAGAVGSALAAEAPADPYPPSSSTFPLTKRS